MKFFFKILVMLISAATSLNAAPFAYVANYYSNLISIVDVGAAKAIGYVDNNSFDITHPVHILNSPDGLTTYVIADSNNGVFRIDPVLNKIVAQVNPNGFPFQAPSSMQFSTDGTKAYVTDEAGNNVSIIDVATDTVTGYVTVPLAFPFNLPKEITLIGNKAYVVNYSGNSVSIINLLTNTVLGYVNTPLAFPFNTPVDIQNIGSNSIYVTNFNGNNTSVIDAITDTVTGYVNDTLFPTSQPVGVFANLTTSLICNFGSNKVSVVDPPTNTVTQYVSGGTFNNPVAVHFPVTGNSALVANLGNNTVSVVDMITLASTGIIDSTQFPFSGPIDIEFANITNPPPPPPPPPVGLPTALCAHKQKEVFACQTNLINVICWQQPTSTPAPILYRIYRDQNLTDLAGTVHAGCELCFQDNHRRKKSVDNYYIVSVGPQGQVSSPAFIRVVRD